MDPPAIQTAFNTALRRHQSGHLPEAQALYRQILTDQPTHAGALHYLGVIAHQQNRNDVAVDLIRKSIAQNPDNPSAFRNLATALQAMGQLDDAIVACQQAITLAPHHAPTHFNLANLLSESGRPSEALAAYRAAIACDPKYLAAHANVGALLGERGDFQAAVAALNQAVAINPNLPALHCNLGNALRGLSRFDEAIAAYRRAIQLKPDFAQAWCDLGNALRENGQVPEAIAAARQAIALKPDLAIAHFNLGIFLKKDGQIDEAIAAYQKAIDLGLRSVDIQLNLGSAFYARGQLGEAIAATRTAMAIDPKSHEVQSNLLFLMHYHPAFDAAAIGQELERWNREYAQPLGRAIAVHSNSRDPDRPLRIGYLSADLQDHVVGQNLLPLFRHHHADDDYGQFEITCYAHVATPDGVSRELQQHAQCWRNIVGLSDDQVAQQIREDQIDILVDLALHSAHNRLLVFARKPAPVQVTWLGYCGSTGMTAMDYRLSDPHLDPPDTDLSCYAEQTLRLPRTYWCYQPRGSVAPSARPPVLDNHFVTFGSLNNFAKVSAPSLDLWARILLNVPNSILMLHAPPGEARIHVLQHFERCSVQPARIQFVPKQSWNAYVQTYSQIDIALDPFPFGGGITTCDALWTGVPVITLSGNTAVGRGGRSILSNLGLPDLIAFSSREYVEIACNLARDPQRIATLRAGMRARMLASPLMDAKAFARDIEAIYRQIWRTWCRSHGDQRPACSR
jgi:predicted O-linked N-acetylglucosamine transferase (SPINDLY family)